MYFNNVIRKTLRSGYEKNIEIASEAQKEKSTKKFESGIHSRRTVYKETVPSLLFAQACNIFGRNYCTVDHFKLELKI